MGKENSKTRASRKRTRSEKGLQFDEMRNKSKSPKAGKNKQLKLDKLSKAGTSKTQRNDKTVKPKVSRKIVFDKGKTDKVDLAGISVDQNNNATLVKRCKDKMIQWVLDKKQLVIQMLKSLIHVSNVLGTRKLLEVQKIK